MFTGIIQAVGTVRAISHENGGARMSIDAGRFELLTTGLGDSVAVNGVCLTVVDLDEDGFAADVSAETLSRTTFDALRPGAPVNLEPALTPSTHLGGHLVSGHVDGVGIVQDRRDAGSSVRFRIRVPDNLAKYIAEKGSICVDGVSLTVNTVKGAAFDLNIVPHTLRETTFGEFQPGRRVNLEVDIIARYLERLLLGERAAEEGAVLSAKFPAA